MPVVCLLYKYIPHIFVAFRALPCVLLCVYYFGLHVLVPSELNDTELLLLINFMIKIIFSYHDYLAHSLVLCTMRLCVTPNLASKAKCAVRIKIKSREPPPRAFTRMYALCVLCVL